MKFDPSMMAALIRAANSNPLYLDSEEKVAVYQEYLYQKWDSKGWLGDKSVAKGFPEIKTESQKRTMALLLENQLRFQRQREIPVVNGKITLTQDTATSDEALPTKFALPIVRRAYALMMQMDWSVIQPLPGPTGYIFYLDFIRESDTTNILSVEYNWLLTPELGVPVKGKLQLQRQQVTALKQLMGTVWSLEAQEDARAQLGFDIEQELISAFTVEFVRNVYGRILKDIYNSANGGTIATGSSMPAPWSAANPTFNMPQQSAYTTLADWKQAIYNTLVAANAAFVRRNRITANGILAGYSAAAILQMANTATAAALPGDDQTMGLGITDYGTYAERFHIWATDFLPENAFILYRRNPQPLWASHVYSPYVPIQVMPAVYGDYDASTGAYQNKDAWTRNIRERSVETVTKPYGFMTGSTASAAATANAGAGFAA